MNFGQLVMCTLTTIGVVGVPALVVGLYWTRRKRRS